MSVEVANESGTPVDEEALSLLARFVLDRLRIHPQAELSVLLVDEPAMERAAPAVDGRAGADRRPLVPDGRAAAAARRRRRRPVPGLLGDVVLCPTVAERQAVAAGHSADDELHLLTTHGILHLLGYDHADPAEEREMFGLQDEIVAEWRAHRPARKASP